MNAVDQCSKLVSQAKKCRVKGKKGEKGSKGSKGNMNRPARTKDGHGGYTCAYEREKAT